MLFKLDIKEKNFHGTLAIGGIAGIIEGSLQQGFTLHTAFPGMVLTVIAAFVGALSGFLLKDLFRILHGMKPYRGINNDGWIMGSTMGAFLGALIQVADSANGANLVVGSMAGAYFGAMIGAFPDEFVTPILDRMHEERETRLLETQKETP